MPDPIILAFYRTINYAVYWYSTVYWYRCGVARVGVFWIWPGFSREGARGEGGGRGHLEPIGGQPASTRQIILQ